MPTSESGYDSMVSDAASRTGRQVGEIMAGIGDQALSLKERYIDDAWKLTRNPIRNNPGKTILVAAAVGVVVGSLLRRR